MKALKGNQHKLPQHLQEAIKAAPESPAKQTMSLQKMETVEKGKMKKEVKQKDPNKFTETYNAATGQSNDPYYNPKKAESYKKNAIAKYGSLEKAREAYSKSGKSPAKQTTAGEFAYKKSLKDKDMGKSTKVIDKFTSALEAPFSDKTYAELKKEKRAAQKKKYAAKKSPAKKYKK